jgi:hypothetical protein
VVRHIFQACPVWIYTQSNITSIIYIYGCKSKFKLSSLLKKVILHEVYRTLHLYKREH